MRLRCLWPVRSHDLFVVCEWVFLPEVGDYGFLCHIQESHAMIRHPRGNFSVECVRYRPGNGCDRVAIATERDGLPDRILEIRGFKKGNDRLWNRTVAAYIKPIARPYRGERAMQIVGEPILNIVLNATLRNSLSRKEDTHGNRLCPRDSAGVIMSHLCASLRLLQHPIKVVGYPAYGANPHCGPVPPTVIRLGVV